MIDTANIYQEMFDLLGESKSPNLDKVKLLGNKSDWDIPYSYSPSEENKNELAKWKTTFSQQTPQQADEIIKDYRIKTHQLRELIKKHVNILFVFSFK
jgi:hypothetical protein